MIKYNIQKIENSQRDGYSTDCLLDYLYSKEIIS